MYVKPEEIIYLEPFLDFCIENKDHLILLTYKYEEYIVKFLRIDEVEIPPIDEIDEEERFLEASFEVVERLPSDHYLYFPGDIITVTARKMPIKYEVMDSSMS